MKKLILCSVIIIFSFSSSQAFADLFLDISYMHVDAGDLKKQHGAAFALAYSVHRDYLLKFRSTMTFHSDDKKDISSNYMTNSAGIEYLYSIEDYRMVIRPSFMMGVYSADIDKKADDLNESDYGMMFSLGVGVDYHATRSLAPFLELGYQMDFHSFTDNLGSNDSLGGYTVNLGVRYAFSGHRSIYRGY